MLQNKKIACVIPARLGSTRFAEKMLKSILDKPILQWVWQAANSIEFFDDIIIGTDSKKIADLVQSFGGKYIMTSQDCASGTDRVIEVMKSEKINADIWVNWQGDEPFITKSMISCLLQDCNDCNVDLWSLRKKIIKSQDINSSNIAKVVCDNNNFALYFSRSTIPFYRDSNENNIYYKHVGIYAFTTQALHKISNLEQSDLEMAEKLEQLRFLQNGLCIKMHETNEEVIGIDTVQDLENAINYAKLTFIN
ncbi:3-deoxy-manno-octulosonate cytidylyltransferase [Candidatus Babeliales bacterium]|nr:3-deoxy-manno-octulosonate cytidylyltransferase [Candidatus Babeliales bacterium]MCF7899505.1 3-deoxy-manno-octulosonate cytidylyltransferase [Candidatus Babeliales bacterium]